MIKLSCFNLHKRYKLGLCSPYFCVSSFGIIIYSIMWVSVWRNPHAISNAFEKRWEEGSDSLPILIVAFIIFKRLVARLHF